MGQLVDSEKERQRLEKEIERLTFEVNRSTKMLENQGFVAKAPKALVDSEKEKLAHNQILLENVKKELKNL